MCQTRSAVHGTPLLTSINLLSKGTDSKRSLVQTLANNSSWASEVSRILLTGPGSLDNSFVPEVSYPPLRTGESTRIVPKALELARLEAAGRLE